MENYLSNTQNTNLRLSRIWNSLLMISVFLFISQLTYAQRVPVPCTGTAPFTLIGEDASSPTAKDAKIKISGLIEADDRVGYWEGSTYGGTSFAATAKFSTLTDSYVSQTLDTPINPTGTVYTIRVYKADTTCYYDKVFTLDYVNFNNAPLFPDIEVEVEKSPSGFVALGTSVTITVKVRNRGTGPATGVEYTVGLPDGLTGVTGTTTHGTYSGTTKKWLIGNVPVYVDASTEKVLTLTGTVTKRGIKYVNADLTAEDGTDKDSRPTTTANPSNSPGEDDFGSVCISTPFDYCSNDEYTISLPSYKTIKWFKGTTQITAANEASNGVRMNADSSLTVFAIGEYSYTMTVGPAACPSGGCCPISVEAGKPPVLVAPTTQAICFNTTFGAVTASNTQTSPNGEYKYQWYNSNGAANPTTTKIDGQESLSFTAFPTAVGVYTYKLKAYEVGHPNCADSITVTLEIKVLPEPVLASNTPVCTESPLNLTATPSGATTYAWSGPAGFTGSNIANPTIASAALTNAGTYVVTVTNVVGCSATASTTVVVNAKPAAPIVALKDFCAGDQQAALSATALVNHTLYWYGNDLTGGVGTTSANTVNPTSAGLTRYYVSQKVDATSCESNRAELVVDVHEKPAAPKVLPVTACQFSNPITLNINETSTGYTVLWYGLNSTGGTGSTVKDIAPTNATGTTSYYVSWKDNTFFCESNRSTIPVTILETPVPVLASNTPVCAESPINLTATPAGASNYSWAGPSGFTGSNIATPTITSAASTNAGTYVVTVTNGLGCSATASTTVVVNVKPAAPIVAKKDFCEKDAAAQLTATALNLHSLYWYGNDLTGGTGITTANTVNPTSAGITRYYVSQKVDATGCESNRAELVVDVHAKPVAPVAENKTYCQGIAAKALIVTGAAQHTFLWYGTSSTGGTGSSTAPVPLTNAVGTTTYYVSQTDPTWGCESDRDNAIVIVNRTPDAPIVASKKYCQDDAAQALAATAESGNTIIWYNGGTSSTTAPVPNTLTAGLTYFYVSQAIPGTGCESSMSGLPVTIDPKPVATVISVNSLCIGSVSQNNAKLILTRYRNSDQVSYNIGSAYVAPPTATAYATVIAGGIFASNLPNPTVDSQPYTVRIKNSYGCIVERFPVLTKTDCGCPGGFCEPATIIKTK
jgi:uncharacterized repeat protein (TIGR01451 family)